MVKKRKSGSHRVQKKFTLRGRAIDLTIHHAEQRANERGITADQIVQTVRFPQQQRPSELHRFELFRLFFPSSPQQFRLKVVVADNDETVVPVVTVIRVT